MSANAHFAAAAAVADSDACKRCSSPRASVLCFHNRFCKCWDVHAQAVTFAFNAQNGIIILHSSVRLPRDIERVGLQLGKQPEKLLYGRHVLERSAVIVARIVSRIAVRETHSNGRFDEHAQIVTQKKEMREEGGGGGGHSMFTMRFQRKGRGAKAVALPSSSTLKGPISYLQEALTQKHSMLQSHKQHDSLRRGVVQLCCFGG